MRLARLWPVYASVLGVLAASCMCRLVHKMDAPRRRHPTHPLTGLYLLMPAATFHRVAFILLAVGAIGLFVAPPAWAQRTLVHCGTLIDPGVSDQPMTERTVIVEEGTVQGVEQGYTSPGSDDAVVDLKAAYCMPGLIDSHTHLSNESRPNAYLDRFRLTAADRALKAVNYARTTLMSGFTTVRDVGGYENVDYALRDAINQGTIAGPRMFIAGKSLAITGGHADPTNGFREDIMGIPAEEDGVVDGVASARQGARQAIKDGADLIKITATGGVLSVAKTGSAAQFFEDEIEAIVKVANDFGMKVAAHAHGDEGMQRAIQAGVSSIEHGTYMSEETMQMMKDNEVYLVPTITAGKSTADSAKIEGYYVPIVAEKARRIGPIIQNTFAKAYEMGVPIAFGTDAGVFRHGRNAKEFEYMVEAGMPPMEALYAATYSAADLLGKLDMLGTLEEGKVADLVAVPSNPLDDISVMNNVIFVMKDGTVYKQDGERVIAMTP